MTRNAELAVIAILAVAFLVTATMAIRQSHDPSHHHRATLEYRGTPCEEDEVLWWVSDGVRACTPLDDIEGR